MLPLNDLDIKKMVIKTTSGEVIEKETPEIVQTLIERYSLHPCTDSEHDECSLFDERDICIHTGTVESVGQMLRGNKVDRLGWWFPCFSTNGLIEFTITIEAGLYKYHARASFPSVTSSFADAYGNFKTSDLKLREDKPCDDNISCTKIVWLKGYRIVVGHKCLQCVREHLFRSLNFCIFPTGIDKYAAPKCAKKVYIGDIYSMMKRGDIPAKYGCAVVTDNYCPIASTTDSTQIGFFEEMIEPHMALYRYRNIIEFNVSMHYERTVYRGHYSAEETMWIRVVDQAPENSTPIGYTVISDPDNKERFGVNIYITEDHKWYAVKGEQLADNYIDIQFGSRYGCQSSDYEDIEVKEEK